MHGGRGIGWGERGRKREKICESECGVALTILILYDSYQDVNIPHYRRGLSKTARIASACVGGAWASIARPLLRRARPCIMCSGHAVRMSCASWYGAVRS